MPKDKQTFTMVFCGSSSTDILLVYFSNSMQINIMSG